MGSSMTKIREDEEAQEWEAGKLWLYNLAEEITAINPSSSEFRDLQWLITNKEKILNLHPLINLSNTVTFTPLQ